MKKQWQKIICVVSLFYVMALLFACKKPVVEETSVAETTSAVQTAKTEADIVNEEPEETTESANVVEDELKISNTNKDIVSGYLTIKFGNYYKHLDTKEKIDWLILDKAEDYTLLLSKNVIDCKNFNDSKGSTSWEESSIRKWLNEVFLKEAFSDEEITKIGKLDVFGNTASNDKVSLLNVAMCKKYFGEEENKVNIKIQAKATDYAISEGLEYDTNETIGSYKNASFFLTDKGDSDEKVAWVGMYGHVYTEGENAKLNVGDGIRPIICVRNDIFTNGVLDSINKNLPKETVNISADKIDGNVLMNYTNIGTEKVKSTNVVEMGGGAVDLASWKYGMTPIEWVYIEPNTQLISNISPNNSAKFSYKKSVSSGEKGCYIPIFTKCDTYGDDFEGRMYVYEDYTKIPINEMKFANKFSSLKYNDYSVKALLEKRYEITDISDGVIMAGDVFVNVVYVSELDDIISKLNQ